MSGGTEAFPDLGRHCQHPDCHQLDFLPFKCDACHKVLCLEHRSYKSHECPNSETKSRKVVVCEICSTAIETTGIDEKASLEKHEKSGDCDPKKKKKPTCPVRRCKEVLTFSNNSVCKSCNIKVCLKHRFPADHACSSIRNKVSASPAEMRREINNKFLAAFASRNGKDCGKQTRESSSSTAAGAPYTYMILFTLLRHPSKPKRVRQENSFLSFLVEPVLIPLLSSCASAKYSIN